MHLPPGFAETGSYLLHPSLLDAALQGVIALFAGDGTIRPALPFALRELEVFGSCPDRMWVWIRYDATNDKNAPVDATRQFDLDLSDEQGRVCVTLRGFSTRVVPLMEAGSTVRSEPAFGAPSDSTSQGHSPFVGDLLLLPVWNPVAVADAVASPDFTQRVLVLDADRSLPAHWCLRHPNLIPLDLDPAAKVDEITSAIKQIGQIDRVLWIAPESASDFSDLIVRQENGVRALFRVVKAVIQAGYGSASLAWTVITFCCQAIRRTDPADPTHSAVHGLVGSMAKEYPNWTVRPIDLSSKDVAPSLEEILKLSSDPSGNVLAYRDGQWHEQKLVLLEPGPALESLGSRYRSGGVYVVLGGAGGVGVAWSEYMLRQHHAQVVWLGRRDPDDTIRAKIDSFGKLGPKPEYVSADATDLGSLQAAVAEIKRRFGAIHGVVHSAIVLLDQGLATMSEDRFSASLSAKLDTSVNLVRAFAGEPLDFFLFFSSLASFVKPPGQANYAAGCTFEDAFALHLMQTRSMTARVINWGYWGDVGVVSAPAYRQRMERAGIASIQPATAMHALEFLLSGPVTQLALVKTTRPLALPGLLTSEAATFQAASELDVTFDPGPPHTRHATESHNAISAVAAKIEALPAMEASLAGLLYAQLLGLGFFESEKRSLSARKKACGLIPQYDRWMAQSLRALTHRGYIAVNGDIVNNLFQGSIASLWEVWNRKRAEWAMDQALQPMVALAQETLAALPGILTGARPATDVLFPRGSANLVAALYRSNPVADYFNDALAEAVVAVVLIHRQHSASRKMRILEIGAGTGGATAAILQKLQASQEFISEYYFTDISKSFMGAAQQAFGHENPFLRFGVLDVSKSLDSQNIAAGLYDVVVASNVLHATPNVHLSLRNVKAALRAGGALIVNELSGHALFAHLTFGLLEGWWLHEDEVLRIPGGPALAPTTWRIVLENEGFVGVEFLTPNAESLGQQIIFAKSDGIARQPLYTSNDKSNVVDRDGRRGATAGSHEAVEKVRSTIRDCLAESLGLDAREIQYGSQFREYGLDSIIAVQMVNLIGQRLGLVLETTVLFDYDTVRTLAEFLVERHSLCASSFQRDEGAPSTPSVGEPAATLPISVPSTYQRVLLERPGQIDGIQVVSSPCRPLAADELRVAVKAFSLNFADLLCVKGLYPTMPPYPFTPGFEASGVVIEVGSSVRSVQIGDAVIVGAGESLGGHASMWICSEEQAFLKPKRLSFEDACALPAVSMTVIDVFRKARPQRGERILIQTATGGAGLVAVQMAHRFGLEILATAGSQSKLDYLAGLGVPHGINYREVDFESEVKRITNGEGVDIVINTLPGEALQKGLRCLRSGGRYVEIAMIALKSAKSIDLSVLHDNQSFFSLDLRKLARFNAAVMKEYQEEFLRLVDEGCLQAVIHNVFSLDQIKDAYAALETRSHIGKVVVRITESSQSVSETATAGSRFPELVRLNGQSQGRPVFWLHGGVGGVEMYQPLALKIPRPFFGIQARGWMTDAIPIRGIRAMANYYCSIIRSVQNKGPYDLGGYSLGGMLAYEVARCLQGDGQSVDSLVMLDSPDSTYLDIFKFSKRTATLQAVNGALFSKVLNDPDRLRTILIDRSEVDSVVDDEALLKRLISIAQKRGMSKEESQLRATVQQSAKLHDSYELDKYRVKPLPGPQTVNCFYFRNGSRRFWGDLESYLTMTPGEVHLDGVKYWEEWERELPGIQILDVESSSHLTLLAEPRAFDEISRFCAKLYSSGAEVRSRA